MSYSAIMLSMLLCHKTFILLFRDFRLLRRGGVDLAEIRCLCKPVAGQWPAANRVDVLIATLRKG